MIIVKISSNSVEVAGSDEDNLNIALAYLETVKAAAVKLGVNITRNTSLPVEPGEIESGEKGPLEIEYLALSGKQKMRTTREEKNSGMSREEIAEARIQAMNAAFVEVSSESDDETNQY